MVVNLIHVGAMNEMGADLSYRTIPATNSSIACWYPRRDDGRRRINFSQILGGLSAAALSNAYFPPQERGITWWTT
jgi:hypothetical protein